MNEYEEQYCYHCGYHHPDASDGNFPETGCDDYEESPKEIPTT